MLVEVAWGCIWHSFHHKSLEVRALCRTFKFFHSNLDTPCLQRNCDAGIGLSFLVPVKVKRSTNSILKQLCTNIFGSHVGVMARCPHTFSHRLIAQCIHHEQPTTSQTLLKNLLNDQTNSYEIHVLWMWMFLDFGTVVKVQNLTLLTIIF